ncbi:bifunctional aminoglycoside phosphotransferase/ATP-binding protein [Neorhodopirellula pilleata]|uniref:Zeta toxin n=1 Tax=Neorhodopirellula pilleata TaxID=2714738 RepID=A0A5C6A0L2_9BACT|nr:bifunctional aminoglycoside phosphotransferase/ATP-binding protein [Neorhodopirellula pilleata]TWT93109.1 Zeta toxin [Neorhodopirellula pilleata]
MQVHETHISIVFLAGEFAYKIKKAIHTDFLDYRTLDRRKHFCDEEVRLDGRYSRDLYIGVVPIGWEDGHLQVGSKKEPVEFAVKMRRFPAGSLLSERLAAGKLTTAEVHQQAETIADFHQSSEVANANVAAQWPDYFVNNVHQIFQTLEPKLSQETQATLKVIQNWIDQWSQDHPDALARRVKQGAIRECHGDLHVDNVVQWDGRLVPFDGIEFSEQLRWIDVLCDAAFLEMDLAYRDHLDLARTFMNHYLETTGDYESLELRRPFLIYRALVRALVAIIRSDQSQLSAGEREEALADACQHVRLAYRFTLKETPQLWITHGFSGSGKTTFSETVVQRHDAIRLRSDTERKRLFGLHPTDRPSPSMQAQVYSDGSNERTYTHLESLAKATLQAGYGVIVDATFLRQRDRQRFHDLARREGVEYVILDCRADHQTLRQRVADRMAGNQDASDANLDVLEHQFRSDEPLTPAEMKHVVVLPDFADRL